MTGVALPRFRPWPLTVLWLLAGTAVVLTVWRFSNGLASISNINDAYPWGFWTGFFMTMIAYGSAAFTIGLLAEVLGKHEYEPLVRPGVFMGQMFYTTYAIILLIELGRPWVAPLVFVSWAPTSPLWEIALIATVYTGVLTIETTKTVAERYRWDRIARLLALIYLPVVVLGVSLSHLHQSTLGTALNIVPLKIDPRWWSDLLPLTFMTTAYLAGFTLLMIEHVLATHFLKRQPRIDLLAGLSKIVAGILVFYLIVRIGDLLRRGIVPSMLVFDWLSVLLWIEIVGGAVIPMVMLLQAEVRQSKWAMFTAACMAALGLGLYRLNATVFAMEVKSWESYIPAWGEILTSVGALAGMVLLYIVAVKNLPIHEEPPLEQEAQR